MMRLGLLTIVIILLNSTAFSEGVGHRSGLDSVQNLLAHSVPSLRVDSAILEEVEQALSEMEVDKSWSRARRRNDDRDHLGWLFAEIYCCVPGALEVTCPTSEAEYSRLLETHGSSVIPALGLIASNYELDLIEAWKALTLLSHAISTESAEPYQRQLLEIAGHWLSKGDAVQEAVLVLFEECYVPGDVKWKMLFDHLGNVPNRYAGPIMRRLSFSLRESRRHEFSVRVVELLDSAKAYKTMRDAAFALRKNDLRSQLPRLREIISTTFCLDKAWYISRLVQDWEDRESISALRVAVDRFRYVDATEVADILEIMCILDKAGCEGYKSWIGSRSSPAIQKVVQLKPIIEIDHIVVDTIEGDSGFGLDSTGATEEP